MQNCYAGDIGDYVKYGLLRALTHGHSLGVAWYLYPDEDNNDGQHIDYLNRPQEWRKYDCELFDTLYNIVNGEGKRRVSAIEESGILGTAVFSGEVLEPSKSREWRLNWFKDVQAELKNCDVIFADPDNSLREDNKLITGANGSGFLCVKQRTWPMDVLLSYIITTVVRKAVFLLKLNIGKKNLV